MLASVGQGENKIGPNLFAKCNEMPQVSQGKQGVSFHLGSTVCFLYQCKVTVDRASRLELDDEDQEVFMHQIR